MSNLKDHEIQELLKKIEDNAREFESVPLEIRQDDNFVIQALQKNALIARFLNEEELNSDRIAFSVALLVENHKHLISKKLQDDEFYLSYICQKIKNKEIDNTNQDTYINKNYLSVEENVMKIISNAGYFKMRFLHDDLKDKEHIVHLFCEHSKVNQVWASNRIKEEAAQTGVEVSKYVKTKLFYEKMDQKFSHKKEIKGSKI